ncbi:MAG: rhodanese-like domain-containing protein [Eubacteriales bacterium]|nr:rhodanese-like domain-containing protein [Eubacteriales bacterium]
MRKTLRMTSVAVLSAAVVMSGFAALSVQAESAAGENQAEEKTAGYTQMTMDEAKEIFEEGSGEYIILDVRTAEEYADGHIPGAVNLPNESITDTVLEELPDTDAEIYVYCRSGRRSLEAAEKLAAAGYTHIIEIGGIQDWTGETEQGASLIYTFGKGYNESDSDAVTVSVIGEDTIQLSALEGSVTEELKVPIESIVDLRTLVDEKVGHLQEDMSDPCVAEGGFAYLYVDGKRYGGHAVQNSSFDEIKKKILETAGSENIEVFREKLPE